MNTRKFGKITSILVSLVIVGLLIMSGPVQAFVLSLDIEGGNSEVVSGESFVINSVFSILGGDNKVPVEILSLEIFGQETRTCEFYVNGSLVNSSSAGCGGISIEGDSGNGLGENGSSYGYGYGYYKGYGYNFGYGYGYSNGDLKYTITMNTAGFSVGSYNSKLVSVMDNKEFSSNEISFNINSVSNSGGSRTSRGNNEFNESLDFNEYNLTNSDFNNEELNPENLSDEGAKEDNGGDNGNFLSWITGAVVGENGVRDYVFPSVFIGLVVVAGSVVFVKVRKFRKFRKFKI